MDKNFNIIIAGVGGQGLITLTQILAEAAFSEGYEVKTSELHGLSQRGGSVETHIRFGKKIYTPLVDEAKADLILALEIQEGLRKIAFSNKKTVFVVNDSFISYPEGLSQKAVLDKAKDLLKNQLRLIPASEVCKKEFQKEVLSGIYLLGYASYNNFIPLKPNSIFNAIAKIVPERYLDLNRQAFSLAQNNPV